MIAKAVAPETAPTSNGPFSPAVRIGEWIFVSAQRGIHPSTGLLDGNTVLAQSRRALLNIGSILQAAGAQIESVVMATVCLAELSDLPELDKAFSEIFGAPYPARTVIQSAIEGDALVQISCVARAQR